MQRGGEAVRDRPDDPIEVGRVLTTEEFTALYREHVALVFGFLAKRVGPQLAEELTAQTFSEAWAGRHRFDGTKGTFRAWVLGIASHQVARHWRHETRALRAYARHGAEHLAPDAAEHVGQRVDSTRAAQRLAAGLATLRHEDRTVVLLWADTDMSYEELAAVVGIPVGTVRSRLSRARRKLAATAGLDDPRVER